MTPDLLKGLNAHLTLEFRAAHEYLAMSIWLAEHDLPGFAKWMNQQSADERMHAQRIIDHLVERDQKVKLPAVAAPPMDWKSAEALCAHVMTNEQEVTASINDLYAAAEKAKDRPATIMLQWFVNEQMEEEAAARAAARPHPAGRQHRCGPADDRPGAGLRQPAGDAGATGGNRRRLRRQGQRHHTADCRRPTAEHARMPGCRFPVPGSRSRPPPTRQLCLSGAGTLAIRRHAERVGAPRQARVPRLSCRALHLRAGHGLPRSHARRRQDRRRGLGQISSGGERPSGRARTRRLD